MVYECQIVNCTGYSEAVSLAIDKPYVWLAWITSQWWFWASIALLIAGAVIVTIIEERKAKRKEVDLI